MVGLIHIAVAAFSSLSVAHARPESQAETLSGSRGYQAALQRFQSIYAPRILSNHGLRLEIQVIRESDDEGSPYYFGGASIEGSRYVIAVGDYFPRYPGMTTEAFLFLLCHEAGHLLGEGPKKPRNGGQPSWASGEAESDFYSARVCLPQVLGRKSPQDIVRAGESFFRAFHAFLGLPNGLAPRLGAKDPTVSTQTVLGYVALQCRLDTVVAGAYGHERPECWYKGPSDGKAPGSGLPVDPPQAL